MPGDLVGGGFPTQYPFLSLLGRQAQNVQGNLTPRSNLEWNLGGSPVDLSTALVSGDMTLVPVPVVWGDALTYVDIFTGAGATASTPTHQWAALFSGVLTTSKPVGTQSVDGTTTAIAASARLTFTLGATYVANPTDSPYGYIYVGIGMTASTVPSLVCKACPTACQYSYYTDVPLFQAGTISAAGATAPTSVTLASVSAIADIPIVVLR